MHRLLLTLMAVGALASTLLWAESASADLIETSAGVKVMAGASMWTTPSDRPMNGGKEYEGLGFAGNAGGFSYGSGLYFEARFIKFVGLELDVIYDKSTLKRNVDFNGGVAKVQEKIAMTNWRFPVLVKGNLPTPFGRLVAMAGVEHVHGSSADLSTEFTKGQGTVETDLTAEENNYWMMVGGLGVTIDLLMLEVPLELRASKNMGQESAFQDRVDFGPNTVTVDAQSSWDFRLSAGVGYRF